MVQKRKHRGNPFRRYKTKEDEIANNKNYTWTFYYFIEDPITKKKVQKYKGGFPSKKEAENELLKIKSKLKSKKYIENDRITLEEYLTNWLKLIKVNIKHTTYDYYENAIIKHIIPEIGKIKLSDLTVCNVENFYTSQRESNTFANGYTGKLKENSLSAIHSTLRKALNDAVDKEYMYKNPVIKVSNKPSKKFKYEGKIYDLKEIEHLLKKVNRTDFQIPVTLAGVLGMRRGEIFALKWENINFDKKTICINHNLTRTNKQLNYTIPKTKYSIREISMPDIVYNTLKKEKDRLQQEGNFNESLFVISNEGNYVNPGNFSKNFTNFLKREKMEHITFHSLRHSAATIMIHDLNIPVKVVSQILGHSSIVVTLNMYCTVFKNTEYECIKKIDNAYNLLQLP